MVRLSRKKFIDYLIYRVTQNFEITFRWLLCPTVDLSRKEAFTGAFIFSEFKVRFLFPGVKGLVLSLLLGVFTPVPTEYHARVTGVNAAIFVANLHYLKSMKRQHQLS